MDRKYTILKVLIRNSTKGFTLLELLVGLVIMSIVSGLALNAIVQNSTAFNKDKKNIETNQNLSAVLEMIGNDIRQAGENINDGNFPAIEFQVATAAETANTNGLVSGSSKIIVRRAVSASLTLCQNIAANSIATTSLTAAPTTAITPLGTLTVADNAQVTAAPNCAVGTATTPLFAIRPNANFVPNTTPATVPLPSPPTGANGTLTLVLPSALRQARDYRCQQVNPNPIIPYNSLAQPSNADFCPTTGIPPSVRLAVSDGNGHMLILNQTGETDQTVGSYTKYGIQYNASFVAGTIPDPAIANNAIASTLNTFNSGDPIYLIEERVYTLVKDPSSTANQSGILTLSVNGGNPQPLIKGIANFNISARLYTDTLNQTVNPTPQVPTVTAPATTISATNFICPTGANQPTSTAATTTNPQYICQFNYNTLATDVAMNWKQLAGIKVALQAKYDGTGENITATTADTAKLRAAAEYFPRNVLSK
jgi:prepilin-type N-terminal cleavage/methylation domain-containing protein